MKKFENHPVDFDPRWSEVFKSWEPRIKEALGENLLCLHHIGSTAIPGLMAKPILDLLGEAKELSEIANAEKAMTDLGFEFMGEFGISQRAYFRKTSEPPIHLHVFPEGHFEVEKHLLFRDYLLSHPEAVTRYGDLKRSLLVENPESREKYQAGKNDLIQEIMVAANDWKKLV